MGALGLTRVSGCFEQVPAVGAVLWSSESEERDYFLTQLHDYGSNSTERDDAEPRGRVRRFRGFG